MKIAFAGNPNSGKTTMYNALTGRNEKVGNWAGVTVDKKEALIKRIYTDGAEVLAVDLPGAYSMSAFTSEETVTHDYIKNENPDVIINIVDATNLSRSLFFTTQLLELGIPVVVALNKADINEKKHTRIDAAQLSKRLGCPVVETVSTVSEGLQELMSAAMALNGQDQLAPYSQGVIDQTDREAVEEADRKRFAFVNRGVNKVESRKVRTRDYNFQDKIDEILTYPVIGLVIRSAGRGYHRRCFCCCWFPAAGHGYVFPDRAAGGLRLHGPGNGGAGPHFQKGGSVREICDPLCYRHRLRDSRCYGGKNHS